MSCVYRCVVYALSMLYAQPHDLANIASIVLLSLCSLCLRFGSWWFGAHSPAALVNASTSQGQPDLDRLSLLNICGRSSFSPSATCEYGCLVSPFGTRKWPLSQAPEGLWEQAKGSQQWVVDSHPVGCQPAQFHPFPAPLIGYIHTQVQTSPVFFF